MSRSLGLLLRRVILGTAAGPLRPVWALLYDLLLKSAARYVRAVDPGASTYARGSLAARHPLFGYSDFDIAVVVEDDAGQPGRRGRRLTRRWERICRAVPALGDAVDMAVYEQAELGDAGAGSTLVADHAVHLGAVAADEAGLRIRPGLGGPSVNWRLLAGPERRAPAREPGAQERRIAAWLELQFLWRCAFTACVNPSAPDVPYLCVKLVADPVRIWLWLVHREQIADRRAAIERALRLLPEEEHALRDALALRGSLGRAPRPPLERMLPSLVRLSVRIAGRLRTEVADAGTTPVHLRWQPDEPLALPDRAGERVADLVGSQPRLLPLADWRARAWPLFPDDAFAPVDLDVGDPAAVGAASAAAGEYGPYPALRADGLLVLPGPGLLRAVQCAATDPVSLALVEGQSEALFPDVAGWSAYDCARRAVDEHRSWLGAQLRPGTAVVGQWMTAQARTTLPDVQTLGRLLSAAQADLFLTTLEEGNPVLPVTMAATARLFDERDGDGDGVAEEAYKCYRAARVHARPPSSGPIAALRRRVLALPRYSFDFRWPPRV